MSAKPKKTSRAEAVVFLEELKELLDKHRASISCSNDPDSFLSMDKIILEINCESVCEFYNPAYVSPAEIEDLLRGKPLGHQWLVENP